jgi:hypothetical protein
MTCEGVLSLPLKPDRPLPTIATQDIAATATRLLPQRDGGTREKRWPPWGENVAADGEFSMAIDTQRCRLPMRMPSRPAVTRHPSCRDAFRVDAVARENGLARGASRSRRAVLAERHARVPVARREQVWRCDGRESRKSPQAETSTSAHRVFARSRLTIWRSKVSARSPIGALLMAAACRRDRSRPSGDWRSAQC